MDISLAESDAQKLECFSTLSQLRPHLDREDFLDRLQRQQQQGYQLAYVKVEIQVLAVAGFCISESFSWGKFMYVCDLVVDETVRSQGYGQQLFAWLLKYAKGHDCEQLHLDSGVQRFDAHRFYLQQRMNIVAHHFALDLLS